MRRTTVILSVLTAGFATSTAYLAHELHLRDSGGSVARGDAMSAAASKESTPASSGSSTGAPAIASNADSRVAGSAPGDAAAPAGVASPTVSAMPSAQGDPVAGFARQFLARLDDANQRPALLEEQRAVIRRQYEKLKEKLHMGDSAFEQFATLLAEEQLQAQESWARCAVDSACDSRNPRSVPVDHTQEYLAMLGTQGAEAFTQYRASIGERDAVAQLRGRLPDNSFLPDAQAEKLIAALLDERQQYSREAAARGANLTGWGTNLGMLWYTEDSGSPDQYVAEATQFSQRLRTRAAGILTPAQLAAYAQMQDELLAMFASNKRPAPRQNKSSVIRAS